MLTVELTVDHESVNTFVFGNTYNDYLLVTVLKAFDLGNPQDILTFLCRDLSILGQRSACNPLYSLKESMTFHHCIL